MAEENLPVEISPKEVKQLLDSRQKIRLVDVREPFEFQQAHIAGSELIPMRTIPQQLESLDDDAVRLVVFCHHGTRSMQVVQWLRGQGLENCQSMAGGIDRWSVEVDASVPRYR